MRATVMGAAMATGALLACATMRPPAASSIDVLLPDGKAVALDAFRGRVVILDVCASWAMACNLNARLLDEVEATIRTTRPNAPLEVVTVLLDEERTADAARQSYREVLGVSHLVVVAGPRVRRGRSGLGAVNAVPRVVILDKDGRIRLDASGGVPHVERLIEALEPLLTEAATDSRTAA